MRNNNQPFGTGLVTLTSGRLLAQTGLTLPNGVSFANGLSPIQVQDGTNVSFAGAGSVVGNASVNLLNGTANSRVTVSGALGGTGSLTKLGPGELVFTAANTYTGNTTVAGGQLTLSGNGAINPATPATVTVNAGGSLSLVNAGTNVSNRLGATINLALNGGTFGVGGNAGGATAETVNSLSVVGGRSTINVGSAANPVVLTAGSLTRSAGATVVFNATGGALGGANNKVVVTAPPTLTNGILPFAMVGDSDFAAYGAGGVAAFTGYATTLAGATATTNVKLSGSATLPANLTINSLILAGANATLSGPGTLTLTGGALIAASPTPNSTATVSAPIAQGAVEAVVMANTNTTNLNLTGGVTGTAGLTASGYAGETITVNGAATTGGVSVNGLTLSLGTVTVAAVGTLGALNLTGGTLALSPVGSTATNGLTGQYFNTGGSNNTTAIDYTGAPAATRVDPSINFAFTAANVPAGVGGGTATNFAVRWVGKINVTSAGPTQFQTGSDDGTRLFIDGVQVLNDEGGHGVQNTVGTINLTAGMHDIVLVYAQGGGGANVNLQWVPAGSTAGFVTVPTANLFTADPGLTNAVNVVGNAGVQLTGGSFATLGLGGSTVVQSGTLIANTATAVGNTTGTLVIGDPTGQFPASLLFGVAYTTSQPIVVQAVVPGSVTIGSSAGVAVTFSGSVTSAVTVNLNAATGSTVTFSGNLNLGQGGETVQGGGTVVESGANDYSGPTTVSAGTLTANGGNAIPDLSTVSLVAGTTLNVNANETVGGLTGTGGTVAAGANTLTVGANSATTTYAGAVTGSGSLIKTGTGTLALTGTGTYTGAVQVTAGVLSIDNFSGSSGITIASGATLQIAATAGRTYAMALTLNGVGVAGVGALPAASYTTSLGAATITSIVKLSASDTVPVGGLTVAALLINGTLSVSGGTLTVGTGAVFTASGTGTINAPLAFGTAEGVILTAAGATTTFAGNGSIAGSGGLTVGSTGTLNLNTKNTYTGSNGLLPYVTVGSGATTAAGTYGANGLAAYAGGFVAVPTTGGTGAENVQITGSVTLTQNTSVNALDVAAGATLDLGGFTLTVGSGGVLNHGGATLTVSNGTLAFGTSEAQFVNTTGSGTVVNATVTGSGGLTAAGGGTLTLSAANTYTGANALDGGTLVVGHALALGSGTLTVAAGTLQTTLSAGYLLDNAVVLASANLTLAGSNNLLLGGPVSLAPNTFNTITVTNTASSVVSGVISGSGNLVKAGAGTLIVSNANTYTGPTFVNAGALQVQGPAALGTGQAVVAGGASLLLPGSFTTLSNAILLSGSGVSGGGAIELLTGGNATLTGAITLMADAAIGAGGANTLTLNGILGGAAANLTKVGTGTLALGGANTYTATTTVSAGILQAASAAALGSVLNGTVVAAGATLQLTGAVTYAGENLTLSGTGFGDGTGSILPQGALSRRSTGRTRRRASRSGR